MKARILQKWSHEVKRGRLAVNGCDEHAAALIFTPLHFLLGKGSQKGTQIACGL